MGDINSVTNAPTVLAGVGNYNLVGDVHADNFQSVGSTQIGPDYFPGHGGDLNAVTNAPTVLAGIGNGNIVGDVHADSIQDVGSFHFGF